MYSLSKRASVWEVQRWKSEHEGEDCTRHLKASSKPVFGGQQAPQTAAVGPDMLQSDKAEREQRHLYRLRRAFDGRRASPGRGRRHIISAVSNGRSELRVGKRLGFCRNALLTNVDADGIGGRRMKSGPWQRV
jgi:hypothetical protein